VEPVPCPEGGDVGCLGNCVDGRLAAAAAGQAVVAPLGPEDLGQAADVVLAAVAGMSGRSEPDPVGGADASLGGLPDGGVGERVTAGGAAPANSAADVPGQHRV